MINVKAKIHFLHLYRSNDVIIEISNDGTAPISGVDIVALQIHQQNLHLHHHQLPMLKML